MPLPAPAPRAGRAEAADDAVAAPVAEAAPDEPEEELAEAAPSAGTPLPRKRPAPPERRQAKAAAPARAVPIQVPVKGPVETMTTAEENACRAALTRAGVDFRPRGQIAEGGCGAQLPLEVSGVGGIKFSTAATMRCDAARATADWLNGVVAPAGRTHMKSEVTAVRVAASYHCRTRRGNGPSTKLSEHAMANAIDISAVSFANGETMVVSLKKSGTAEAGFQAEIRKGACPIFTTVIGPGTNAAHADHLHLDRAYRRGGYRMCQ